MSLKPWWWQKQGAGGYVGGHQYRHVLRTSLCTRICNVHEFFRPSSFAHSGKTRTIRLLVFCDFLNHYLGPKTLLHPHLSVLPHTSYLGGLRIVIASGKI